MQGGQIRYRWILLFTLVVGALFLIFCFPTFETSDDATIIRMIDGSKGSTDPHLIYQNVLLGYFYMLLYRIPVRIAWYSVFQCAMVLLCMSVLAWCVISFLKGCKGIITALVLELYLGYECLIQMQYTKTAGLAACAGVMLIIHSAVSHGENPDQRREDGSMKRRFSMQAAAGIALILYGSLMRFQQAAVCVALMGGAILYALIILLRRSGNVSRLVVPFVLAGVLVLGGYAIDALSYSRGRLSGFRRFDAARIELLDHGMPDYSEYAGELKAMGMKKSAYRLLRSWTFADPDVFTAQVLEQIGALKGKTDYLSRENLAGFFKTVPAGMLSRRFFWFFIAAALIWLLSGLYMQSVWNILSALYGMAAFGAMNYYLFCSNRYLVNRVDVPMLLGVSLAFLFLSAEAVPEKRGFLHKDLLTVKENSSLRVRNALAAVMSVLALAAVIIHPALRPDLQLRGGSRAEMFRTYAEKQRKLLYQASEDPDHLYLAKLYTISDDYAFGMFETAPKGSLSNILWLGGWSCNSGCYLDIMDAYGISNPLKDMIDNDKVRLVDNKVGQTVKYLRAYYDDSVEATQVKEIGSFPVYTVRTGSSEEKQG